MKKTYQGGCHCGAVRYEADLDLADGTLRCNCSICAKTRAWLIAVKPDALRLKSGADELVTYRFGSRRIQHLFCKHCGGRSFAQGETPEPDKSFYAIHVSSLEGVSDEDLARAPIMYVDGRQDNFQSPPAVTAYL